MNLHVVVAVIIAVAVWFGIGKLPVRPPVSWILYVLDVAVLAWYLWRFL